MKKSMLFWIRAPLSSSSFRERGAGKGGPLRRTKRAYQKQEQKQFEYLKIKYLV